MQLYILNRSLDPIISEARVYSEGDKVGIASHQNANNPLPPPTEMKKGNMRIKRGEMGKEIGK